MSSEPLWELGNRTGVRTVCDVIRMGDAYLLFVRRSDGQVIVSERHDEPRTALDRAQAIYRELIDQGRIVQWT